MVTRNPLLKSIKTSANSYLYCAKTNRIFRTTALMQEIIHWYHELPKEEIFRKLSESATSEEIEEAWGTVEKLTEEFGLFRPELLNPQVDPFTREDTLKHLKTTRSICLEVTENCNFRCHYCSFSGGYSGNRVHSSRKMSWETAKTAIDFYHSIRKNETEHIPSITFYGGEPLLRFDLIEKCVEYASQLKWAYPGTIHFGFTTNASLLNEHIIRFLEAHEFGVLISLDGPEFQHDQHRVFADGRPSFEAVISKLRLLKNMTSPEYYQTNVSINCVLSPGADILATNAFFSENTDLFPNIIAGSVREGYEEFFKNHPADVKQEHEQRDILFKEYRDRHLRPEGFNVNDTDIKFIRALFEHDFLNIRRRGVENAVPQYKTFMTTCFPGARKVFVDIDGNLHVCERVNRTYPLGNVWTGFDHDRVTALANEFANVTSRKECLECWAFRHCPYCFAPLLDDGKVKPPSADQCEMNRRSLESTLRAFCNILEQRPGAFDYMEEFMIS